MGDIVVCYGKGSCNVIRVVNGTATVLDQISDSGFLGTGTPGYTYGAAIDDTLHVLVTDAGGGTQSSIVKYSISSENWLLTVFGVKKKIPATTPAYNWSSASVRTGIR